MRRCEWKHSSTASDGQIWRVWVFKCRGWRGLGKSKHHPWSLCRDWRPLWHRILLNWDDVFGSGFFKQMLLLLMEDSLLTFPNQQYMMNDNVYYCILSSGLASQKTDNVTNWSISVRKWCVHWAPRHQGPQQCPPRYHWQLLFASDDHFDHLLWAKRISSESSAAKYVVLWASWVTHHPWSRTQCLWHRAGHQQWETGRETEERRLSTEKTSECPSYIFQITSSIINHFYQS